MSEGHFQCVHTIRFSEPTKIGSLETDRVNGPLERGNFKLSIGGLNNRFLDMVQELLNTLKSVSSWQSLDFNMAPDMGEGTMQ